ncbi:rhodanese-like domain-containing protein [Agromyces tardus]|uniref:Rhodanese-like domain-containing protein n=1 Tax=Agromyces tardus TaxID=2583849 RepID=A0A3M8A5Y7_9MICO|nr:rhodanese-like domain-containing protein [Agromyces tardus]RNB46127.1 rhodanese-like domain-containing protein [Agromyces tardus]
MTQITSPAASALFTHVASSEEAIAHFRGRLGFESDVSDVAAALAEPEPGFVLVDVRSDASWAQGHLPGAVHLPWRRIAAEASERIAPGTPVVVYCWGPGCNGATNAALQFALLGHPVKEMLGGFEYWVREGFAYDGPDGRTHHGIDPLTNVSDAGLGGAGAQGFAAPASGAGGPAIACAC